jgi:hypothetical protein
MQTIYTTYGTYLQSGASMRDAIQSHLVNGKLPANVVAGLAQVHAKYYRAHAEMLETGAYRFFKDESDTTSANRHESATKQWNRVIAPFVGSKDKRGGKRYKTEKEIMKQRDFVLKAFKLLSARDRAWVVANAS